MPTPFAALEQRLNTVTMAKLANATVLLDGVSVDGIFGDAYAQAGGGVGMASTTPSFRLRTEHVPDAPIGKALVRDGVTYLIASHDPDGSGMSLLLLEDAS